MFAHAQKKVSVRIITKFSCLTFFSVCPSFLKHNSNFSKSLRPCLVWPLPTSLASSHSPVPEVHCPPATGVPFLFLGHTKSFLSAAFALSPTPHITGSFGTCRPQLKCHFITGLLGALSRKWSPHLLPLNFIFFKALFPFWSYCVCLILSSCLPYQNASSTRSKLSTHHSSCWGVSFSFFRLFQPYKFFSTLHVDFPLSETNFYNLDL